MMLDQSSQQLATLDERACRSSNSGPSTSEKCDKSSHDLQIAPQSYCKKGESSNKQNKACRNPKLSALAQSLFTEVQSHKPKKAEVFQQVRELLDQKAARPQGFCAHFHDIQNFFAPSDSKSSNNRVESFKFDCPSPDEIVVAGKHAAKRFAEVKPKAISSGSKASINKGEKVEGSDRKLTVEKSLNQTCNASTDVIEDKKKELNQNVSPNQQDNFEDGIKHTAASKEQCSSSIVKKGMLLESYKPESWMINEDDESSKSLLHLAFVGNVDAGKSTLAGRLLHSMGEVSSKEMHKIERAANQNRKKSSVYAWILDESVEERKRCLTMTTTTAYFESQNFLIVVLDSPGHKDFIPNMISGTSQADAAILVVDASSTEFESGISGQCEGYTKEHAQLVRSLGVDQLIVAVNKLDRVEDPRERFNSIISRLAPFLRRCGFKESFTKWIPLIALENQNLVTAACDDHLKSWYSGPCLLEAIDQLKLPVREISKPLRLPISKITNLHNLRHTAIAGKLEGGAINIGTKVLVMPGEIEAIVKTIEVGNKARTVAMTGESVYVVLQGVKPSSLIVGGVLCHPDYPVLLATRIELKVLCLEINIPIVEGSQLELYVHQFSGACTLSEIVSILDPKTGKVIKKAPGNLTSNQNALLRVSINHAVCIECYATYKPLGRVILRASGKTVAVGIVTQIFEH